MIVYFGLGLDDDLPLVAPVEAGTYYMGTRRILRLLETFLGFQGYPSDNEHLRIEQYRQALLTYQKKHTDVFYRRSFEADQLATATELLDRRDELVLANWNFEALPQMPERLRVLAEVEQALVVDYDLLHTALSHQLYLMPGFADRFAQVMQHLDNKKNQITTICLVEPLGILPYFMQRLVAKLVALSTKVIQIPEPTIKGDSDLAVFQRKLMSDEFAIKQMPKGDGSLILLKAKRETDIATYVSKLLHKNKQLHPWILSTEKTRTFDNALIQEGLPAMGILSASSARPVLQMLKLAPAFLWEPIDPFKIMEFVTLSVKPLEEELSNRIARQLSQTPGLGGEGWSVTIRNYFDELEEMAKKDKTIDVFTIQNQYNFWFRRNRYKISSRVPVGEVIDIYDYLHKWAKAVHDNASGRNQSGASLIVLSEQAKRIKELLEAQSDATLSFLELERVIRTIYAPSPILFKAQEVGFYPFIHHTGAFVRPVPQLIWWDFVQLEPNHFFSRWYQQERQFLATQNIYLETPQQENERLIWQRKQPILNAQQQLILLMPAQINGEEVHPHSLYSDLQATFKQLQNITIQVDDAEVQTSRFNLQLPLCAPLDMQKLGTPKPFLHIPELKEFLIENYETYSSLEQLLYYPYQWLFRHKTKLVKSSILSLVKDNTLLGNLAHRFFEQLLKEDILRWDKQQIEQWIDKRAQSMFGQEGAILLMYGREPEKINFLNRLKYAAWSLVSSIQNNGWTVEATELAVDGQFLDKEIKAKIDLVLKKGNELAVLDLKWRGVGYRERMIKNQEDLQLVLYSSLISEPHQWAHTAYFIMDKGKMIARTNQAFQEVQPLQVAANHAAIHENIMEKMMATYRWRVKQIEQGLVEVRCSKTKYLLEDIAETYGLPPIDMTMLEMKSEDAKFDDYRTLVNLIE